MILLAALVACQTAQPADGDGPIEIHASYPDGVDARATLTWLLGQHEDDPDATWDQISGGSEPEPCNAYAEEIYTCGMYNHEDFYVVVAACEGYPDLWTSAHLYAAVGNNITFDLTYLDDGAWADGDGWERTR
ncbi:MAG: hypothetical protein JXX28_04655 [Deltaproteobacteria bacterium]|nr:hypothetical protein [Deltaproteobacteria bacterium]